jgi:GNAT superfamily N-acetyltransferase
VTRVRNFEDVRFGEYLVKTWYYSPYPMPSSDKKEEESGKSGRGRKRKSDTLERSAHVLSQGVGQGGEGARGRLWVCDLCFKYMHTRAGWERHTSGCDQMQPPGRKAYRRGSYTIWEVDGAEAQLYCQNLSLFGKLFIDHKVSYSHSRQLTQSVFFHVENFLFYVLCDAATSKRDQVMAFFSKEKTSYDDYNLACIVTFPPHQNRGFGKLLIEFSYYLTRGASSPGTPERPLSDLGLKGYLAFWVAVVLRVCRKLLADAEPVADRKPAEEGRSLRTRKPADPTEEVVAVNGVGELN